MASPHNFFDINDDTMRDYLGLDEDESRQDGLREASRRAHEVAERRMFHRSLRPISLMSDGDIGGYFNYEQPKPKKWGEGDGGILTEASGGKYNGCTICYDYSTLFGTKHKGREITCEEEYELAKAEFVAHFNKFHKKLMVDKSKKIRSFKKVEPSDPLVGVGAMFGVMDMHYSYSGEAFGRSMFRTRIRDRSNDNDNYSEDTPIMGNTYPPYVDSGLSRFTINDEPVTPKPKPNFPLHSGGNDSDRVAQIRRRYR